MDADPWADAPPSPKPSSARTSPTKATNSSPLTAQVESHPEASSSFPEADPYAGPASPVEVNDEEVDGFDDFDDFDAPAAPVEVNGDDGFGDFGDFEEGDFDQPAVDAGAGTVLDSQVVREPEEVEERLQTLSLQPFPSNADLVKQLTTILAPLLPHDTEHLTEEPQRMVGGLSQIMQSESSRDAYAQLTTAPILKPLDWTRSRVRREHLISMGVPVNLDEVDSHRLTALPPLRITTSINVQPPTPKPRRAETIDATGRYTAQQKGKGRDLSPTNRALSVSPTTGGAAGEGESQRKYGLGAEPELDLSHAEELCGIEEDQLSLMSIDRLKSLQSDLVNTSAQASSLLAWSLQLKDAQLQDSATYNGMISELIANAAKVKSAQAGNTGGVFRRTSIRRPQSMSANRTPGRVASPSGGMR